MILTSLDPYCKWILRSNRNLRGGKVVGLENILWYWLSKTTISGAIVFSFGNYRAKFCPTESSPFITGSICNMNSSTSSPDNLFIALELVNLQSSCTSLSICFCPWWLNDIVNLVKYMVFWPSVFIHNAPEQYNIYQ